MSIFLELYKAVKKQEDEDAKALYKVTLNMTPLKHQGISLEDASRIYLEKAQECDEEKKKFEAEALRYREMLEEARRHKYFHEEKRRKLDSRVRDAERERGKWVRKNSKGVKALEKEVEKLKKRRLTLAKEVRQKEEYLHTSKKVEELIDCLRFIFSNYGELTPKSEGVAKRFVEELYKMKRLLQDYEKEAKWLKSQYKQG
jgi:hypothetical protein